MRGRDGHTALSGSSKSREEPKIILKECTNVVCTYWRGLARKPEKLNDKIFKKCHQSLIVSKGSCFSPSIYQCLYRCVVSQFVTFIVVTQHVFIVAQIRASQLYLWWYEDFCQVQFTHWSKPQKSFGEPISYFIHRVHHQYSKYCLNIIMAMITILLKYL